jgi:hypothetical protein
MLKNCELLSSSRILSELLKKSVSREEMLDTPDEAKFNIIHPGISDLATPVLFLDLLVM